MKRNNFINMTNNNGTSTELCGIPDVTLCHADLSPFTPTCCTLFDRKLSIQAISCSFMPYTKLEEWRDTWLLRFHPGKCIKNMHIGKKNDDNSYSLHRKSLEKVILFGRPSLNPFDLLYVFGFKWCPY
jgi:hypothetical protein